ncbi:boron transporter-like protein [Gossypium australe]|uniref:Boron transporter-like protein n=1 Tax=Gossypium australe TaxID=47621 RepID=A0A5B6WHS7_9ROSI|nr:boron transporter-like protein [Gossypium australe]
MGKVPIMYIFVAIIPAVMTAGLYFFDHSVASQMAQQKEFNLKIPSAYHYDILLLGVMTLICGLLGLPPSYGVLPQSPMHTKSLAVLKKQSLLVGLSLSALPIVKKIPTSILWGYFAYMAIDSLPGNQFWGRLLLLFITPAGVTSVHAPYLETVPFKSILMFTLFQLVYFVACYGVTWFPTAGILFPMPFFLLISIRLYILPELFTPECLRELDPAEYEEIVGKPCKSIDKSCDNMAFKRVRSGCIREA